MKAIEHIFSEKHGVRLNVYLHDTSREYAGVTTRPAVLVIPGGGYTMCSDREADCVALGYLNAGFHAFVLRYSLQQTAPWPAPLNDYETAMEFIKEHAEEWTVDTTRIAVCGFSAGGHLAASAATMAKHRPAAAILGYPALRADIANACAPGIPSPIDYVDENTSPCFLFAARDDECVPVCSTTDFQQVLYRYGIQFESHIYSRGNHGFTTGVTPLVNENMRAARWMQDSIDWLGDIWGRLTPNGCAAPALPPRANHDSFTGELDFSCTWGYVASLPGSEAFMEKMRELLKKCPADIREAPEHRHIREILYGAGESLGGVWKYIGELRAIKRN